MRADDTGHGGMEIIFRRVMLGDFLFSVTGYQQFLSQNAL
jgi:hypothetical protein